MNDRKAQSRSSISMHDGIAVWCDCCTCEIEPYWQAVADELGIDLGSDYESESVRKAQGRGPSDE